MKELQFFVPGIPAPGGSKKAFVNVHTGRAVIVDDAKRNKDWRATVALAAEKAMKDAGIDAPLDCPLEVRMVFYMPRPKGHFRTGKRSALIRPSFVAAVPAKKPDVLKLARSTEDAMKAIVWDDDCQTVVLKLFKHYGANPGCNITVQEYTGSF